MYLKRIEIYGFKSFAQKTVLDFDYKENGCITAVVGPNGSGKSNVADAIRWVTGEQSNKNLRSKKSEDVIFCGSTAKPRGSYAEVTIVLSGDKPVRFELNGKQHELVEIEVARKLYRSGESEYLLNRKKVRLTDVQQLLASLGFGQSSYTVIGQGMVDRLLFFTAAERKVLFDEAAGVKQYEIKREQSLRKLESTDTNLIRLRDILTELEPRVVNLRRLVKRAEGRKELENELTLVQQKYYGSLYTEYDQIVTEGEAKQLELTKKINNSESDISKLTEKTREARVNPYLEERRQLELEIAHESEKRDKLRESVAYLRGQMESAKRNNEFALLRKQQLAEENSKLLRRIADLENEISSQNKSLEFALKKRKAQEKEMSSYEEKLAALDSELANPSRDGDTEKLTELTKKRVTLYAKKDECGNRLYALRQELSHAKARQEQNQNNLVVAKQSLLALSEGLSGALAKLTEAKAAETRVAAAMKVKEASVEALVAELSGIEKEIHDLGKQVTELNLSELDLEMGMVSEVHQKLYHRVVGATKESDFAAIRDEFKDFGANLDKLISRFRVVAKAVSSKEREALENSLLETRGSHGTSVRELQAMQFEKMQLEADSSAMEKAIADYKARISEKEDEVSVLSTTSVVKLDGKDEEVLLAELSRFTAELDSIDAEMRKYSGAVSERQNQILRQKDSLQAEFRELRQNIHNVDMEIARLETTQSGFVAEIESGRARSEVISTELGSKAEDGDDAGSSAVAELATNEKSLSKLEGDIAKLRGGLTQVVAKEREFEQTGHALEGQIRDLVSEKTLLLAKLSTLEVEFAKATVRLEDVNEEMRVGSITVDEGNNFHVLDQIEKDVLKLKMENIRRKLETTASVDPETEAEYSELESRATEMTAQVADLTKAKEDLTKVIFELDSRIKHQFSDVFTGIASEFDRYFNMLFGGGNAKLSLGEDEEGGFGIEISANPPGKRVQALTALSGGERTLTSLALLFAILSVNPSPFVVLDEVDAALDESNTVKFIKILEDLAKKTQFIIISHIRDTMKCASSLYGVTMDESHISKLLSVKLTEALVGAKS